MQAILTVVEYIKKSLVNGQLAGAVLYDFAEAFGSVDHYHLLEKARNDFNIRGLLFLHITSFLSGRRARIKIGELIGDWLESEFGMSAGTRLGPLLFIMHLHDLPSPIKPKFTDDQEIQSDLQGATNRLVQWAENESMVINVAKTKDMLFGEVNKKISIKIDNLDLENVSSFKYLCVMLNPMLDFGMHYAG